MSKSSKRMGRPPLPRKQALGRVLGARFRPDEERAIREAVRRSGIEQADWIRAALLAAARSGTAGR